MPDMSLPEELPAETPGVPAGAGLPIPPIPDMPLPEESAGGIEATDVTEVDEELPVPTKRKSGSVPTARVDKEDGY